MFTLIKIDWQLIVAFCHCALHAWSGTAPPRAAPVLCVIQTSLRWERRSQSRRPATAIEDATRGMAFESRRHRSKFDV